MCLPFRCRGLRMCKNRCSHWTRRWSDHGWRLMKQSSDCSSKDTWFVSTGCQRHRISRLSYWVSRFSDRRLAFLRYSKSTFACSLVPNLLHLPFRVSRTSSLLAESCAFDSQVEACGGLTFQIECIRSSMSSNHKGNWSDFVDLQWRSTSLVESSQCWLLLGSLWYRIIQFDHCWVRSHQSHQPRVCTHRSAAA